jgi:predicted small secreted protein
MEFVTRVVKAVILFTLLFAMAACNTIHGAGKDIEQTGKAIERAAD